MNIKLIDITEKPIEKIYKAYRICYSKDSWDNIKIPTNEAMTDFIRPLVEEYHTSPLEQVQFTFSIEGLSRAGLAQLTRHRMFKFNVQSQRYVDASNFSFVIPDLKYIKSEEDRNRLRINFENIFKQQQEMYEQFIKLGVKKEDARSILGQATTCNLIVSMDLNNFRNFLRQRLCTHAQEEIRELAKEMTRQVKEHIPFVDYKVLLCQQGLCKKGCGI